MPRAGWKQTLMATARVEAPSTFATGLYGVTLFHRGVRSSRTPCLAILPASPNSTASSLMLTPGVIISMFASAEADSTLHLTFLSPGAPVEGAGAAIPEETPRALLGAEPGAELQPRGLERAMGGDEPRGGAGALGARASVSGSSEAAPPQSALTLVFSGGGGLASAAVRCIILAFSRHWGAPPQAGEDGSRSESSHLSPSPSSASFGGGWDGESAASLDSELAEALGGVRAALRCAGGAVRGELAAANEAILRMLAAAARSPAARAAGFESAEDFMVQHLREAVGALARRMAALTSCEVRGAGADVYRPDGSVFYEAPAAEGGARARARDSPAPAPGAAPSAAPAQPRASPRAGAYAASVRSGASADTSELGGGGGSSFVGGGGLLGGSSLRRAQAQDTQSRGPPAQRQGPLLPCLPLGAVPGPRGAAVAGGGGGGSFGGGFGGGFSGGAPSSWGGGAQLALSAQALSQQARSQPPALTAQARSQQAAAYSALFSGLPLLAPHLHIPASPPPHLPLTREGLEVMAMAVALREASGDAGMPAALQAMAQQLAGMGVGGGAGGAPPAPPPPPPPPQAQAAFGHYRPAPGGY